MAEPERGFEQSEFERRVRALQTRMCAQDIDALLLTTPADIFYVTGFLTRFWESPARPWFVIVPSTGKPKAVIPSIGLPLMRQSWLDDLRTWDAPDPNDDGVSLLSDTLREMIPDRGCLGTPMGLETHTRMPIADFNRVLAAIGLRRLVDATDVIQRVREIKSDLEIAKIKASCAIADRAFARVPEIANSGIALDQVFRAFQGTLLQEGADWVSYLAGGAGQDGYSDVISPAGPRALEKGDILMLDTGAVRDGYFCDFDRNFAVGAPGDTLKRAHDALYRATEAALNQLRPGMLAQNVHDLMSAHLRRSGYQDAGGRLGHGLGITLTEWPSFTPRDTTPLREGMVLTLEPGAIVSPGKILVHEENIVLRADGPELLSQRAPAEMMVLD